MTEQILTCAGCDKHMATLRDAKVRTGMVVYCSACNRKIELLLKTDLMNRMDRSHIPDFMSWLMRKRS